MLYIMRYLVLALSCLLAAGETAPIVPTADEAAVLVYANAHRAERRLYDNRLGQLKLDKVVPGRKCFPKSFDAVPPLVFSPQLGEAARTLLTAGTRNPDGTVFDATTAVAKTGYRSGEASIAVFGRDAPTLEAAYATALFHPVDLKVAKGKTVPVASAGQVLSADWREVGVAVTTGGDRIHLAMVFGMGSAKRHIGGLVYIDRNRNLVCDPGEGTAGVAIDSGVTRMVTGAGGVWWLPLPDEGAVDVVFTGGGFAAKRSIVAGKDNAALDWRVPQSAELKDADRLITAAENAAPQGNVDKRRPQLLGLLVGTQLIALDDERRNRVDSLVQPVAEEFANARARLLTILDGSPAAYKQAVIELQRSWPGAVPTWFKEALALGQLRQAVLAALAPGDQAKPAGPVRESLTKATAASVDPVFRKQYEAMIGMLDRLPEEPVAKPRK